MVFGMEANWQHGIWQIEKNICTVNNFKFMY